MYLSKRVLNKQTDLRLSIILLFNFGEQRLKFLCVAQKCTILVPNKFDRARERFADPKLLKLSEVNVYCCCLHVFKCLNIVANTMLSFRINQIYFMRITLLNVPFLV